MKRVGKRYIHSTFYCTGAGQVDYNWSGISGRTGRSGNHSRGGPVLPTTHSQQKHKHSRIIKTHEFRVSKNRVQLVSK